MLDDSYINELLSEIENVPFDKSAFQIEHMVINSETPERAYQKTLLQLNQCVENLMQAKFSCREIKNDIQELEFKLSKEKNEFEVTRHKINVEKKEWGLKAQTKLIKECLEQIEIYRGILKTLPKPSRIDFEQAEAGYWNKRFLKDAIREMNAFGKIQIGTQASLESVGIKFKYDPREPDGVKWLGVSEAFLLERQNEHKSFLAIEEDKTMSSIDKTLDEIKPYVAVLKPKRTPDETEATDWKELYYPNGIAIKFGMVTGPLVEENRETLLQMAMNAGSKYAFFVDSDNKLNPGTIAKFIDYMDKNEDVTMLSAFSYHKGSKISVPMNIVDGTTRPVLPHQGIVSCNWCSGMPAVMIRLEHLKDLEGPFFKTTRDESKPVGRGNDNIQVGEDTYFCKKLLDAGLKIEIDTNEIVEHVLFV